jgi:hypothetical protein
MDGTAILGESYETGPSDGKQASEKKTKENPGVDQVVINERLEQLARKRTEAVSSYLIVQANVDAKRIQFKPVQIRSTADGGGGLVEFSLSVE